MGASLVYLDRPVTKKETITGNLPASQTQVGYKYASSAMQGWRLNMVRQLFPSSSRSAAVLNSKILNLSYFWRTSFAGKDRSRIHRSELFLIPQYLKTFDYTWADPRPNSFQASYIFLFLYPESLSIFNLQEDAHIAAPVFDNGISLFAVFDGHGGIECAKFCERFFGDKLREQAEYQSRKDLGRALENTFLGLDKMLLTPKGMEIMIGISKEHPQQTSPIERALRFHADSKLTL